ncbi:carbohydrate-binding protein [Paenibacillus sp. CC-CFT747]|nr:carbohydrate-binding protein [Paenibacillus sp. CC-CFT747]
MAGRPNGFDRCDSYSGYRGWNNWQTTLSPSFQLPEGRHTITFETAKGEYDFARLKFVSFDAPQPVPGMVEAVHYNTGGEGVGYHDNTASNIGGQYRNDGVDIRVNPKGGWNVGWNQTGEWLKYNVNVDKSAAYNVRVWIATALSGGKIRLWLDDTTDLTGIVDIPNTGGWNNWRNVDLGDLTLPEGDHTVKVEIVNGEYEFASLSFRPSDEPLQLPGTVHAVDYRNGGEESRTMTIRRITFGGCTVPTTSISVCCRKGLRLGGTKPANGWSMMSTSPKPVPISWI